MHYVLIERALLDFKRFYHLSLLCRDKKESMSKTESNSSESLVTVFKCIFHVISIHSINNAAFHKSELHYDLQIVFLYTHSAGFDPGA